MHRTTSTADLNPGYERASTFSHLIKSTLLRVCVDHLLISTVSQITLPLGRFPAAYLRMMSAQLPTSNRLVRSRIRQSCFYSAGLPARRQFPYSTITRDSARLVARIAPAGSEGFTAETQQPCAYVDCTHSLPVRRTSEPAAVQASSPAWVSRAQQLLPAFAKGLAIGVACLTLSHIFPSTAMAAAVEASSNPVASEY